MLPWLAVLGVVAGATAWIVFQWHATSRARAWVAERPFLPMESLWGEARRHAERFRDPDWRYLMSEAIRPEDALDRWLVRHRSSLPAWWQARVPAWDPSGNRWIDLRFAWMALGSTPEPRRLEWLGHARRVEVSQAWQVLALALEGNPPPPRALLAEIRALLPSLDARARVTVVAALDRVEKDALPEARALLEEMARDPNGEVSGNARRTLGRAPYR